MDKMRPVPFMNLIERILGEYTNHNSIFSILKNDFYLNNKNNIKILNQNCSNPVGPAAGPHTQLAQNIVASYLVGARFIELKTVQIMDTLEIEKPCIDARDEGYNVEWSTEYTLPKAYDEYLKAWIILHALEALFSGEEVKSPSFIFNMSVGYNLEGIKTEKMQKFISSMANADVDGRFDVYVAELNEALDNGLLDDTPFAGKEACVKASLKNISKCISPSVTLSTMHGCPPKEIESICSYMLSEKGFDTYVKLNPTLLGFDGVRGILDNLGYNYVGLNRDSFDHDLQYPDAVAMLKRLLALAKENGRLFGVKLTNTLGCINDQGQLPGAEMYMSGRTLLPISTSVALKLAKEFDGDLKISYSGGANALTIQELFETGIRPITVATDMLKPGGYARMKQMSNILADSNAWDMDKIDLAKLEALNVKAKDAKEYISKDFRGRDRVKLDTDLELTDCFVAPCVESCPIHQDVPAYVQLMGEGRYEEALAVIYEKNALPNITGWICDHQCQNHCTRMDYEGAVKIRELKKLAVENGFDRYIESFWEEVGEPANVKACVVGAGPAGLAAAYFLARAGFKTEIFEREENAGGVVANVIPEFRIPAEVVQKDIDFVLKHGVKINYGAKDVSVASLKAKGADYIFYAIGAEKETSLRVEGKKATMSAVNFLKANKACQAIDLGSDVIVVGGGNTAMDAARAAKRTGAKTSIVYRRGMDQMPADKEEYLEALHDGVEFYFLSNPKSWDGSLLVLTKMVLGEKDASGRRSPVESDETFTLNCTALITAIGEKPDVSILDDLGVNSCEEAYVIGDASTGPSTVVKCIASASDAVEAVIDIIYEKASESVDEEDDDECSCDDEECSCHSDLEPSDEEITKEENEYFEDIHRRKAVIDTESDEDLTVADFAKKQAKKCLECSYLCNKCVEVCPNRANVNLDMRECGLFEDAFQILHIDAYCNECGNCETFCPHNGGPYLKKFTLFSRQDDFENSKNSGFLVEGEKVYLRSEGKVVIGSIADAKLVIEASDEVIALIEEVLVSHAYLLNSVEE